MTSVRLAIYWLIIAVFLAVGFIVPAHCALPSGLQIDIRATAADTNGGGYLTTGGASVNYSTQDAPQVVYTDLIIGVTTTQLTSVLNPVTTAHPGNIINITGGAGCTTGRYYMASQAAGTATMDRAVGTAASVCTGNLGGSVATVATANGFNVAGNTLHIKSGTYTFTAKVTNTQNVTYQGYEVTQGDYTGVRPLITTATNSTPLIESSTSAVGDRILNILNINFSNTAATRDAAILGTNSAKNYINVTACNFDGFQNALDNNNQATRGWAVSNVEIKNSIQNGIRMKEDNLSCSYCNIHNNGANGIDVLASDVTLSISNSIISDNTTAGINGSTGATYKLTLTDSTVANNGVDGIRLTTLSGGQQSTCNLSGSVIYGNAGIGVNAITTQLGFTCSGFYTAYGSNSGGNFFQVLQSLQQLNLSANPFQSATNYTPNNTAGGGALLRNIAYSFPGGTTIGVITPGASVANSVFTGAAAIR